MNGVWPTLTDGRHQWHSALNGRPACTGVDWVYLSTESETETETA